MGQRVRHLSRAGDRRRAGRFRVRRTVAFAPARRVSRRLAIAGLVLGAIGLFALIADAATVIAHG